MALREEQLLRYSRAGPGSVRGGSAGCADGPASAALRPVWLTHESR